MEREMILSNQRMTSLEIAEVTGKPHNDVLKAIRRMEPAWEKVQGGKFSLSSIIYDLPNGGKKEVSPYFCGVLLMVLAKTPLAWQRELTTERVGAQS